MKTKAYLYIITAAICWGLIGLFVRTLAAQGFSSMQIVALRSLAAAICVTLPLLRSGSAALRIRLRDLWLFAGTGICSLVFFNYCYFNAMQQISLAVAALLLYTAPVFVMLMSLVCFGEAFTRTKALALLLTFSGCACVTGVFGSSLTLTLSGLLYCLGRYAKNLVFTKNLSHVIGFHITLSNVNSIRIHIFCDSDIIIDNKWNMILMTQFFESHRFFHEMFLIEFLFPKLYKSRSSF